MEAHKRIRPTEEYNEIVRCMENPYYFATKYLYVSDEIGTKQQFTTRLSEKEFNSLFKQNKND